MSEDAGLPKITMMISAVAIAFAGILAFLILKWTDSNAAATEARLMIEELGTAEDEVSAILNEVEGRLAGLEERSNVLIKGKLSVCNLSTEPVSVSLLAATHLNDQGAFETFNSETLGKGLWRIGPGETQALTYAQGAVTWDGDVSYYAMWLMAGGQEYPYAGTWPADEEFCIRWTGV